jgi:hypothetical protein
LLIIFFGSGGWRVTVEEVVQLPQVRAVTFGGLRAEVPVPAKMTQEIVDD